MAKPIVTTANWYLGTRQYELVGTGASAYSTYSSEDQIVTPYAGASASQFIKKLRISKIEGTVGNSSTVRLELRKGRRPGILVFPIMTTTVNGVRQFEKIMSKSESDSILANTDGVFFLAFSNYSGAGDPIRPNGVNVTFHYEIEQEIITGISDIAIQSDSMNFKIEYSSDVGEQDGYRIWHLVKIETTNGTIEVEAKGKNVNVANLQGQIVGKPKISLMYGESVGYSGSTRSLYLPIQTVENLTAFDDYIATIQSLEPSEIEINVTNPLTVTWVSSNQKSFKLTANGNVYEGTSEQGLTIPANVLQKGTNTLKLEVFGDLGGDVRETTFTGYGKPSAPVFSDVEIYNTAKPNITWTCDEQHSYKLELYKGSELVQTTTEVTTTEGLFIPTNNLINNTEYTIKLKVKNDKGLWSDEVTKVFTVSFAELTPATLNVFQNSAGVVVINVINSHDETFSHCEVWRRSEFSDKWQRIAKNGELAVSFNDRLLASNVTYYYKAISYNNDGGGVESAIKSSKIHVSEMEFIDLGKMQNIYRGYARSASLPFTLRRVTTRKTMLFEGNRSPVVEIGKVDYSVYGFDLIFPSYQEYKQFVNDCENAALLLFRSPQGHLTYGIITDWVEEKITEVGFVEAGFTFTEVEFEHSEIYDAGKTIRVVKTDAGYTIGAV